MGLISVGCDSLSYGCGTFCVFRLATVDGTHGLIRMKERGSVNRARRDGSILQLLHCKFRFLVPHLFMTRSLALPCTFGSRDRCIQCALVHSRARAYSMPCGGGHGWEIGGSDSSTPSMGWEAPPCPGLWFLGGRLARMYPMMCHCYLTHD